MPRPRPLHLVRQFDDHDRPIWYVRIGHGPRTRLRATYGSADFWEEYRAAIDGKPLAGSRAKPGASSLQWLWNCYRESGAWTGEISHATRRQRANIMKHVLTESGHKPYAAIGSKSIEAGIEARSKTPAQARNFLDLMKGLFRWAKRVDHVKVDPTLGVEAPKRVRTKGFPAWIEADVEAYYKRWPIGTRQRVWLDVILYTGLRRGDLHRIGKQHVRETAMTDGTVVKVASISCEKGGERIEVTLPILAPLQATLDAGPIGDLAWICGANGRPFVKEAFGNEFSAAARAAGIKKSAHGVRKIAATIAAENGATGKELDAIFGWTDGGRTSAIYTAAADRKRLAMQAMTKLEVVTRDASPRDVTGTSIPSEQRVRGNSGEK